MPNYVVRAGAQPLASARAAAKEVVVPTLAPRSCRLQSYTKRVIPEVVLDKGTEIIAYASPDSTYAVTKRLMDGAKSSILIGIYDFSAPHMREILLSALARGVSVSLMLDIDSKSESHVFDHLVEMGVKGVEAPSCANDRVQFFAACHEKVIIIDGQWCLVQSGNYTSNSIPLNELDGGGTSFRTGNRDTGLAIRSKPLAKLFTAILTADMALVRAKPTMLMRRPAADEDVFLVEKAPKGVKKRFKSQDFALGAKLSVIPVLSPDNYMAVVPGMLARAKRSILIEQQYIRANQPQIRQLLNAIATARRLSPGLDVRIVLGKIFDASQIKAERANLDLLARDYKLKLGTHIRYINTDQLVHCHNKMVVVDGEAVLVSSQNWSDSAVSKNREAGLWLRHPGIAGYFKSIFDYDWSAAFKDITKKAAAPKFLRTQTLQRGGFIRVEKADYEEV